MDQREETTLLTETVKRYINGYLYSHWNRNRMKGPLARQVVAEMEMLEDKLRTLGADNRKIQSLINYGEVLISVAWTEITESGLRHIMKLIFDKEV